MLGGGGGKGEGRCGLFGAAVGAACDDPVWWRWEMGVDEATYTCVFSVFNAKGGCCVTVEGRGEGGASAPVSLADCPCCVCAGCCVLVAVCWLLCLGGLATTSSGPQPGPARGPQSHCGPQVHRSSAARSSEGAVCFPSLLCLALRHTHSLPLSDTRAHTHTHRHALRHFSAVLVSGPVHVWWGLRAYGCAGAQLGTCALMMEQAWCRRDKEVYCASPA